MNFRKLLFMAFAVLAFASCSDDDESLPYDNDLYKDGFYVLNEGWFGHESATINHFDGKTWNWKVFAGNNAGMTLGSTGNTGIFTCNSMLAVSKMAPQVTKINTADFKCQGQISLDNNEQASSIADIDGTTGILTTNTGVYTLLLEPLKLGTKIYEGFAGDVCVFGKHILAIVDKTIISFDAETYAVEKEITAATTGFAMASGSAWAANGNKLIKINNDLTFQEIELGEVEVNYNKWAYTPTCVQASASGKEIFFAAHEGADIYKFDINARTYSKFFTAPEGYATYGAGIAVHPRTGNVYITMKVAGWDDYTTNIHVIDGRSGAEIEKIEYDKAKEDGSYTYWLPSQILFR